jgi:IS30 family transposase
VSREVSRHGGRPVYRAHEAEDQAWDSALRPKRCLLAVNGKLRTIVASKLILDWSPEQISGWLKTYMAMKDGGQFCRWLLPSLAPANIFLTLCGG